MATTTNYSWNLPTVGGNQDAWGDLLNANWTAIDTLLGGVSATEIAILDGATVTTAELNILDGVTATTAEINTLDGVTATTAELNVLDGVTATTAELNILDGVTASTAELNYVDGVTSNIQTQLDGKQAALGFTPVQQGGGTSQTTSKLYIGWSNSNELRLQVDVTDFGANWPIYANVTTANALGAIAGASIGAVGTYIWAGTNGQTTFNAGQTYAGSLLVAAGFLSAAGYSDNTAADITGGYTLSGTWRSMGEANNVTNRAPTTLFLRVA